MDYSEVISMSLLTPFPHLRDASMQPTVQHTVTQKCRLTNIYLEKVLK